MSKWFTNVLLKLFKNRIDSIVDQYVTTKFITTCADDLMKSAISLVQNKVDPVKLAAGCASLSAISSVLKEAADDAKDGTLSDTEAQTLLSKIDTAVGGFVTEDMLSSLRTKIKQFISDKL